MRGRPPFRPDFHGKRPSSSRAFRKKLGSQIRKYRNKRLLSQKQVGEPTVTAATVSAIERGKVLPSLKTLRQISKNLGFSMRVFIPNDK